MKVALGIALTIAVLAAGALVASAPASAETCHERFVRLLIGDKDVRPTKIHVTQDIKGGLHSTNVFYMAAPGHWMTEVIDPPTMPWTLAHDDVMYTSTDKGETWQRVRTMDSEANAAADAAAQEAAAETVRDAACGEAMLDGVPHDTVEATYTAAGVENHTTYWVDRGADRIVKSVYEMRSPRFESVTTQVIEDAPGLSLPTPK